jgi:hypothetical protein
MLNKKPIVLFSPLNVIHHYQMLNKAVLISGKKIRSFRKVEEANFVAEALVGRREADGRNYWLRLIGNEEQSPDIKTYSWKEPKLIGGVMEEHFVEVTEYEAHSNEPIVEFLEKHKLNKYRDDPNLIILCRISRETNLPSLIELKQDLVAKNTVNPILFCGRTSIKDGPEAVYRLIQIDANPNVMPEKKDFKIQEGLLNMEYEGVLVLDNNSISGKFPETKHYPFETLGFIPEVDGTYLIS